MAETTMKMMKLSTFCKEYDMPRTTAVELVHSSGFPAYKLGKCWYVDIPAFEKWRVQQHMRCYKYA